MVKLLRPLYHNGRIVPENTNIKLPCDLEEKLIENGGAEAFIKKDVSKNGENEPPEDPKGNDGIDNSGGNEPPENFQSEGNENLPPLGRGL